MMNGNKRICIYFFYDREGIADRYVDFFLSGLSTVFEKTIIVSNGDISEDTRRMFQKYTEDILVRENKGFDVWAYKEAMEHVGWEELAKYEELALVNCTIMGPVYPFSEMFSVMDQRTELDFWGITAFGKLEGDPFGYSPYGYLPEHIQSHFIVIRKKLFLENDFQQYWENMPEINSYEESIGLHESVFTKKFSDMGYKWDVYVHAPKENGTSYYLMMDPVQAIRDDRCPIFKRRSFFQPAINYINESAGEQPYELFRYLKNHTDYDTDMILENLIRTCYQDDIARTLRLTYVLPSDERIAERKSALKIAAVFHLYYMDLLEDTIHYASSLPENADLYITVTSESNAETVREAFAKYSMQPEIRVIENRGRDVSALLVGAKDIQDQYDLICFYHDKKTNQVSPYTTGKSFAYKVSESALCSREYVENVIRTFEKNPRLGLATNTPPNHAMFLNTLAWEWGNNFENTRNLAKELGLKVPMSEEHPPIAPLGTVFWYRTAAMKKLFQRDWNFEDFPPEPNDTDGTLLHAIERVYSFVVQDEGYYPAHIMPDHIAAMEMQNLGFYVRMYNYIRLKHGINGDFAEVIGAEDAKLADAQAYEFNLQALANSANLTTQIRLCLKRHFPKPIYRAIVGGKRAIFGPRGISQDEAEVGDPK